MVASQIEEDSGRPVDIQRLSALITPEMVGAEMQKYADERAVAFSRHHQNSAGAYTDLFGHRECRDRRLSNFQPTTDHRIHQAAAAAGKKKAQRPVTMLTAPPKYVRPI